MPLKAGVRYAYAIHTSGGFYGFAKSAKHVYPGGAAIQHGTTPRIASGSAKLAGAQNADRTFFINPSPAPRISALRVAFANHPAVVLFLTGSPHTQTFADRFLEARGSAPVRIHTFQSGGTTASPALRRIAERTGGEYRNLDADPLLTRDH